MQDILIGDIQDQLEEVDPQHTAINPNKSQKYFLKMEIYKNKKSYKCHGSGTLQEETRCRSQNVFKTVLRVITKECAFYVRIFLICFNVIEGIVIFCSKEATDFIKVNHDQKRFSLTCDKWMSEMNFDEQYRDNASNYQDDESILTRDNGNLSRLKETSKFYHSHRTSSVADDDNGNGGGSGGGADKKTWMDREILSFAKEATQPFIFMFALVSEVRRNGRRGPQGRNFDGGPLDFLLPSEVVRGGTRRTIAHCGRHSFADDDDVTRQVVMPRRTKKSGRESLLNPSPNGWAGEWLAAWPVGSSLPRTLYSHLVSSKSRGNSEQRLSLNSKTTF
ncbi:hypothetical protein HZH66_009143 [Vespula vulgaris]|uniref:Uncharacterized protein n=1 Tax=Vespula vulgaris TaxID=7454 RepID=A0A834JSH9_VESVU|nr:hypothetical protein HZH66_009143 [Vespula vulgaris]